VPPSFAFPRDVVDVLARDPVRPALYHVASDGTVDARTFADMARESTRWARLLGEHVTEPGGRVVIALDPGTHWAASIVGAMRIGLIPVLVGSSLGSGDLAARLEAVDPDLVVVDHRSERALPDAVAALVRQPAVLTLEESLWTLVRVGEPIAATDRPVESPALIVFTSGSTSGTPRPVLYSHSAPLGAYVPTRDWLRCGAGDLLWCNLPDASAAAVVLGLFGPWSAGAAVLHLDRQLEDSERIELLERFQPTVAVQTPKRHAALLRLVEDHDLSLTRLAVAASTGEKLDTRLAARFEKTLGLPLRNGYATAETGVIAFQPADAETTRPHGSIGWAAPGQIVAPVDEQGYVTPTGVVGDLGVFDRTPGLCAGYWTGWPPTEEVIGDSWTLTGDRAFYDQDGQLWLDGAKTEAEGPPGFLLSRAGFTVGALRGPDDGEADGDDQGVTTTLPADPARLSSIASPTRSSE
jgi:acetyl-CoA synthetase